MGKKSATKLRLHLVTDKIAEKIFATPSGPIYLAPYTFLETPR
jgi:hypothetical protein